MQAPAPHGPGLPKHDPSVYQVLRSDTQFCCCLVWCFHSHVIMKVVLFKARNEIKNEITYSFPFFLKLLRYFIGSN